ncbi:MAG: AAA family ATPase [Saprospiraceae bacterium]|nr:AAA family ATPase [Saprospiraceae bacterium]
MKKLNQEQLDTFIKSFQKVQSVHCDQKESLYYLFQLFSLFFEGITNQQNISFTTLFSRIAYSSVHFNFKSSLTKDNHLFRRLVEQGGLKTEELNSLYQLGVFVLWQNLQHVYDVSTNIEIKRPHLKLEKVKSERKSSYRRVIKAFVVDYEDLEDPKFHFFDEKQPHLKKVGFLEKGHFAKQFKRIIKYVSLPITINLIDTNVNEENQYWAKAFVYKPDLLIGVTSISECFQADGESSLFYLAKKVLPNTGSIYMLIGNIVNYFLDELIHDSELSFKEVIPTIFQLAPLEFAKMPDDALRNLLKKVEVHFDNLKKVVKNELIDTGITKEKAYLEPSFFSPEYGIQGRLDLYHFDKAKKQSDIVELKSGKLFKANGYGLNENHYIQTLLYDLIMESVYNGRVKSNNYILYSSLDAKRLRYAPRVRSKQYKSLEIRNDIVLIEDLLLDQNQEVFDNIFNGLQPDKVPKTFNFLKRDANAFHEVYSQSNALEKAYYKSFFAFINREFQHSKIGRHGVHETNGLASLWLDPMNEKIENFRILSYLEITENLSLEKLPIIHLEMSEKSAKLSRFRIGDIAVFYPDDGTEKSALNNQLFKCTLVDMNVNKVSIRLRARQKNLEIFQQFKYWHLESDTLDGGFKVQFDGIFNFLKSPDEYKQKVLGLLPPEKSKNQVFYNNSKLTEEQHEIVNRAISSKDYFLLWGPPGTGKTSVMIKSFVDYYYNQTDLNIILLAYTNRAVDEICQSIDALLGGEYIRIGSRYATLEKFKPRLLSLKTEGIQSRGELQCSLKSNRVFVSTVSSFQGRTDLSGITDFDLVIIDEASQLLEPMLVGFLSKFKKYILIGDHKQLPAVVGQDKAKTEITDTLILEKTNLSDMSCSLFERMYSMSKMSGWDWSYGGLMHQGRMHQKILDFVSPNFYENKLEVIDGIDRLVDKPTFESKDELTNVLINERMLFIDTPLGEELTKKTNEAEANVVSKLADIWVRIYHDNKRDLTSNDIGIITPFRSQISMIGDLMNPQLSKKITLDTIERYQGGSRNQIIISFAVSQYQLLDSISNVSEEGIDRKLNVALTRAKENVILIGSAAILKKKEIYKKLIDYCSFIDYQEILNYEI